MTRARLAVAAWSTLALAASASGSVGAGSSVRATGRATGAARAHGEIPHERLARDFLAQHGLEGKQPEDVEFEAVLAAHWVRARLGAFELLFPVADLEARGGDLKACSAALLAAQAKVLDWDKPSGRDQKALRADLDALRGWIEALKPAALAKCRECAGKDLTIALAAPEGVSAASGRFSESFGKGAVLGLSRETPLRLRILLVPTRKEFAELASFLGWLRPDLQAEYWVDGIADWTTCWYEDVQGIALEYASANRAAGDYASGDSTKERGPTVMQQQLVQLAAQRLFEQHFGERVPAGFVGGLAMNLVIDQFGEVDTRIDGDLRARVKGQRQMFVPGVASDGFLPKDSAETRWRENHGKDHFVRVLRAAQKDGEGLDKTLSNKLAGFGVHTDQGGKAVAVAAPFFGSAAAQRKPPPTECQGDFLEMIRAYKSAFIWWLQTKAAGGEKASREKFAQLLEKLGDPQLEFEAVFASVYEGAALSDAEASKESLEGKFLVWLSHQ